MGEKQLRPAASVLEPLKAASMVLWRALPSSAVACPILLTRSVLKVAANAMGAGKTVHFKSLSHWPPDLDQPCKQLERQLYALIPSLGMAGALVEV